MSRILGKTKKSVLILDAVSSKMSLRFYPVLFSILSGENSHAVRKATTKQPAGKGEVP